MELAMINATFDQAIIWINGRADIELHCDGKAIFAYSYTLGRNFENWEIVKLLEEVGYAFNK